MQAKMSKNPGASSRSANGALLPFLVLGEIQIPQNRALLPFLVLGEGPPTKIDNGKTVGTNLF